MWQTSKGEGAAKQKERKASSSRNVHKDTDPNFTALTAKIAYGSIQNAVRILFINKKKKKKKKKRGAGREREGEKEIPTHILVPFLCVVNPVFSKRPD